jgi:predicted O-methyltransferase YrrM
MFDITHLRQPAAASDIAAATRQIGFPMASYLETQILLRTLAATRPGGNLLELGTGTGMATAWLLDGMDATARLTTVDNNENTVAIARKYLGDDPRITFRVMDGAAFIQAQQPGTFDLIFADTWPGKYYLRDETLRLLKSGGMYIIDDLRPRPDWEPERHTQFTAMIAELEQRTDLHIAELDWSTGIIVAVKI